MFKASLSKQSFVGLSLKALNTFKQELTEDPIIRVCINIQCRMSFSFELEKCSNLKLSDVAKKLITKIDMKKTTTCTCEKGSFINCKEATKSETYIIIQTSFNYVTFALCLVLWEARWPHG